MTKATNKAPALDWTVFLLSGGILVAFVLIAFLNLDSVSAAVNAGFTFSTRYFGAFWQFLLFANFAVSIGLAVSRYGSLRLGGEKPEMSTFRWISIFMCTVLAAGGVFWCFAEPMYHFTSVPPNFTGITSGTSAAVAPALAQSFHHWGFLPWAICGTLATIVLMYLHYHRGLPLKPRSLLYPIWGDRFNDSIVGSIVDAVCIIGVAAGTIGPIGFLGLQLSYSLQHTIGLPDVYGTQLAIIAILVVIYTLSTVSGIEKGIQLLSTLNVAICIVVFVFLIMFGPGSFIVDSFFSGFGVYLNNFLTLSFNRSDPAWLSSWTVFFWGWFLGYGPMTAMFVARISRGRTIREIVLAEAVIAPLVTNVWFGALGGSSIFYELQNPGSISTALKEGGLPAVMLATVRLYPLATILVPVFIGLVVISLVAGGDSISFTMAMATTGEDTPPTWLRAFWGIMMGAVAAILLQMGAGGISALQSFIVVSAVPVSLVLLPLLVVAPRIVKELAAEKEIRGQAYSSPNFRREN